MPSFQHLQARDLFAIERQESQQTWLGMPGAIDQESADHLAAQRIAWTARADDGEIIACFGINETFEHRQGVAWSLLSGRIGTDHLALTRFMRQVVAQSGLRRIELLAAATDLEGFISFCADSGLAADPTMLVASAMSDPTAECRFAVLLGFKPVHLLRQFGGASESYMLFERIDPAAQIPLALFDLEGAA